MTHDHAAHDDHAGHAHGHHHSHAPANFGTAFLVGIVLNTGFVIAEVVYGTLAKSLALVADAGHNAGDVLGLILAWGAYIVAKRRPSQKHTYGLRRSSILASLTNVVLLLIALGAIMWEAVQRLQHPALVAGGTVSWVAAAGIAVNGITAYLFASGRKGDLNLRGAFQHMLADAVVSAGVVVAGIVIVFTHWLWLDPLVSLVLAAVILYGTWGLLCESLDLALDAVPESVDLNAVKTFLSAQPGVSGVHDLHVWGMSTTETALTVHLVVPAGLPDEGLQHLRHELHEQFGVEHATVQVEQGRVPCDLLSDEVV
ncbi:cation diffusion facilitator family transporter (plasmid) [Deinococcus sp. KNUC1210]|uniref:cation diffusion facilitator family transporter n=1 Tax=Deinococcus sp. KNUC1210 TaxID=2917691 RepID=UPI001EF15018|nr:cation diffusion facilitator family transporter [Deinococcus sp. KNUC1210]ULH17830.1 cation diffusion facilitator family transporter [Deinococcus sp. KNUC1210]